MAAVPLELTRKAARFLEERGFENARLDAELLLAGVLGISRLDLYLQHDRPLAAEEIDAYRDAVRRRLRHEPLQYIRGSAAFRELELLVDPRVLIPRPETEVLVGAVLEWARGRGGEGATGLSAVDIGTGSGAIALSLLEEGPFERVTGTDVSAEALEVAAENARRAGLLGRLELRGGGLWEALRAGERFDVVVSNPPYVAESERASLAPEVREWEPAAALFADEAGLRVLNGLVDGAPDRLKPGGLLALEIGATQAGAVVARIERRGAYAAARVIPDLAGRDRVVLAERAAETPQNS